MSDEELRHKKETDAEISAIEAIAQERQDFSGLYCSRCGGSLMVSLTAKPASKSGIVLECADCGAEFEN